MPRVKEILTVVGTLACAVGVGFIMQSSDTAKERYGDGASNIPDTLEDTATSAMLDVRAITLTSGEFSMDENEPATLAIALPETDAQVIRAAAPQSVLPVPEAPGAVVPPACPIEAEARASRWDDIYGNHICAGRHQYHCAGACAGCDVYRRICQWRRRGRANCG